ncbi:MAG: glycosyltransferase [Armatimonadetes bacterium]|nr:glycosyltransferase [Armatimonadota bacterium]
MDVSVVVPTYNRRPVLERTIQCLLAQDTEAVSFEIVVVDDQSTDDTWAWLKELAAREDRLIALRNPRKGRGQARNAGTEAAKGRVICYVDDDVWVEPRFIRAHWLAHEEHGEDTVAIGGLAPAPETKRTVPNLYDDARLMRAEQRLRDHQGPIHPGLFRTGNVSVSRSLLTRVGGFDESFTGYSYEDSELGHRLQRHGARFVYVPEAAGVHFTEATIAGILRKKREAASSAILFLQRCPEAADRVSHPFEIAGVPTTARHDSWAKALSIRLFSTRTVGTVLALPLYAAIGLRMERAALFWLSVLGHQHYCCAFRRAVQELSSPPEQPTPEVKAETHG